MLGLMADTRHDWVFPEPLQLAPELRAAARAHGLGPIAATVLARRGVATAADLAAFLGPAEHGLGDPGRLPDADRLLERIDAARRRGERVMVFGDFDADGLTGLAQLVITLGDLGIDAVPYVPSRLEEGHGLSLAAVEVAVREGVRLIVTVDTGSTSVAEVDAARARGVDVVVTDHHHLPDVPPAAVALVNPQRGEPGDPHRILSGSGVAFTVSRLLLGELLGDAERALALADLATIGTVSDVVPIVGQNRAIARLGIERLRAASRPGLAALLARANVSPARVDLETVGFVLAPRLNAAGRVGEAIDAARLLLARTDEEAAGLAGVLDAANATRRDLMRVALAEARGAFGLAPPGQVPGQLELPDPGALGSSGPEVPTPASGEIHATGDGVTAPALVAWGPWPVGILGLVAGRLADETGRPAVIGTRLDALIRASCRGDGTLDLAAALDACDELLVRHGGHSAAAGFELAVERWDAFAERFLALAAVAQQTRPHPTLEVDLALPARLVDYDLFRDLARLGPFGTGNPEPLVAVLGLTVQRVRTANGGHTQLVLRRERDVLDGIAFGWPELIESVQEGDHVDVVARLTSRVFGGLETLQLEVRDVSASGAHPRAAAVLERSAGRADGRPVGPGLLESVSGAAR
jgi:single-stranded-DNA-specific exonuclease